MPLDVTTFLEERHGAAMLPRLHALGRAAVERFEQAAKFVDEAIARYDGSREAAGRLSRAASHYRAALAELDAAVVRCEEPSQRAIRQRRTQRAEFHRGRR